MLVYVSPNEDEISTTRVYASVRIGLDLLEGYRLNVSAASPSIPTAVLVNVIRPRWLAAVDARCSVIVCNLEPVGAVW